MQASKGARPGESHSICLISPATSCDNTCECCLPGKLIKDQVPAVFKSGAIHIGSLSSTYQNCRLPEGKQIFSINHIVYTVGANS